MQGSRIQQKHFGTVALRYVLACAYVAMIAFSKIRAYYTGPCHLGQA